LASLIWHGVELARGRKAALGVDVDLGLFSALAVLVYAVVLELPGRLNGPFYPLVYVLVMIGAAFCRPLSAVATVAFAGALEAALRLVALGEDDLHKLGPRLVFLAVFSGLNVVLFRGEVSRVRSLSKKHMDGELLRLKEAARAYRLVGAGDAPGDRALHSAVEEVRHAVRFALDLVQGSLGARTAALLLVDGNRRLIVHEAVSDLALADAPQLGFEGIFSAALTRREPVVLGTGRAAGLERLYLERPDGRPVAIVPLLEGTQVRALLVVERRSAEPFAPSEVEALGRASHFVLRSMQNERVFASLERQSREQGKLYRAAESLAALTSEAEVIEVGVESARALAAFDFAAVTLFHKKSGAHEICAVSGEGADQLVGRTFRHNAGLVSMVVANRHALPYRGEYEPSRQSVFSRGLEPPPMPSLLVLPLIVHERVLGTLVLGSGERGAFDDNVRPTLEVLASHMAVSLANARMLKRLEEQATTDGMTGLLNKRTLILEAERRIKSAERFKKPLSVMVTDIDHFKKVNDTYGHDIGDVVIKGMGEVLKRLKRDTDLVGRFGGEEFVIVCEQTDQEGARNLAERLRKELEVTVFQTEMGPLQVTCSVGVSTFPQAGMDWETLFKATDEALYVSKRGGRNQVTVWSPRLKGASSAA
ncbi:MAG TPA: diguanylate cyclase, partial [Polyangiaceae bacterium]|nr:diguanylate cyclase [Polyangiaceae bacterium]